MTEKEQLEYFVNNPGLLALLGESQYCPPWEITKICERFKGTCLLCWRAWLLGYESNLCYLDTDSLNPDLPEDMY